MDLSKLLGPLRYSDVGALFDRDIAKLRRLVGDQFDDIAPLMRKVAWLSKFGNGPLTSDVREMCYAAIDTCTEVIKKEPDITAPYRLRAQLYSLLGELDTALCDSNRAVALDDKDESAFVARGTLLYKMDDYGNALRDFERAVEIAPDCLDGLENKASCLIRLERYDEAFTALNRAMELNSTNALLIRAHAYHSMKLYEKSLKDCDEILDQDKENAAALAIKKVALLNMGKLEGVLNLKAQWNKAIPRESDKPDPSDFDTSKIDALDSPLIGEKARDSVKLLMNTAKAQFDENWDELLVLSTALIEIDPSSFVGHSCRAFGLNKLNRYEEGLHDLNCAIELSPGVAALHNNRAWSYCGLGRFEEALKDIDEALAIAPKLSWSHSNRANAYIGLGRYKEAVEAATTGIQMDPSNFGAYSNRANALALLGRLEEAQEDAMISLELKDNWPAAHSVQGFIHFKMGNLDDALKHLTKSLELDRCFFTSYYRRSQVYKALGNDDSASQDLLMLREVSTWEQHKYLFEHEP